MTDVAAFIRKAKIAGYAAGAGSNKRMLPDGGNELTFIEANLTYTDTFYGFNPFSGTEIVRENGRTVWLMNYTGKADCTDSEETENLYAFLRAALFEPDPALPLRGPSEYVRAGYRYMNAVSGDINCFSGSESISFNNREIYRLDYNGAGV